MKLRKFKQGSCLNIFKPANSQSLINPTIIDAWISDLVSDKSLRAEDKSWQVLSNYFKYDITKNILSNTNMNLNEKTSAINSELSKCHVKINNSKMYSISQKLSGWIMPLLTGGTLGICCGTAIGLSVSYKIRSRALESQYSGASAQDFLSALDDLKNEMKNSTAEQVLISGGIIISICLISAVLYNVFCVPTLDRITDLESAKTVINHISR